MDNKELANSLHTQIQYKMIEKLKEMNKQLNHEIEEHKLARKELSLLNKNLEEALKVKSHFLSTMSHEIRTPLNVIQGYTQLILKEIKDVEIKEQLQAILLSTDSLSNILNQVLTYSKIDKNTIDLNIKSFNLNDFLNNLFILFKLQAKTSKLQFKLVKDMDLPEWVIGDSDKLQQILINLLENAFKFTKEGRVELSVEVFNTKSEEDPILNFTIKDTGIGIAQDKRKVIFDHFVQADTDISRSYNGVGLGLSISQKLVKLMSGNIELESTLGEGSTFTVKLPFTEPKKAQATTKTVAINENTLPLQGLNILLVDDLMMNQKLGQNTLKRLGATPLIAKSGVEAIELVKTQEIDIILMDLHMPELNGFETVEHIRKFNASIPILAFTADTQDTTRCQINDSSMNGVIYKPLVIKTFTESILEHLY